MDKEYYREKIKHFIAGVEDEKDLKRIYDYAGKKWCKSESSFNRFSSVGSVENQNLKMSVGQYKKHICECIYEIDDKDGLDRIFNLAMRIMNAQPEKSAGGI